MINDYDSYQPDCGTQGWSCQDSKETIAGSSELQENLILILFVVAAIGLFFYLSNKVSNDLAEIQAQNTRLKKEFDELKGFQEEKDKYEIQKSLLNQKIKLISELKDNREGPVKLMEDLANALPDSAWLQSIWQGYDTKLVEASISQGKSLSPDSSRLGDPRMVKVVGWAKTADSVTNFADRILNLNKRYYETNLSSYSMKTDKEGRKQVAFELFSRFVQGAADPNLVLMMRGARNEAK